MSSIIVKTDSKNLLWSDNKRYKVGQSITHNNINYTNITGGNSEPGVGTDWKQSMGIEKIEDDLNATLGSDLDADLNEIHSISKLGIGKPVPLSELDIIGNTSITGLVSIGTTPSATAKLRLLNGTDDNVILRVDGLDTTSEYISLGVIQDYAVLTAGRVGAGDTGFLIRTAPSGTEEVKITIEANGDTGFNLIPTERVHVSGNIKSTGQIISGGNTLSTRAVSNSLRRSDETGFQSLTGGSSGSTGGAINVYGSSHSTKADFIELIQGANTIVFIDGSGKLNTKSQEVDGDLNVTGTTTVDELFTSEITNSGDTINLNATSSTTKRNNNTGIHNITGGTSSVLGGGIKFYGSSHASKPSHIQILKDSTVTCEVDASNNYNFQAADIETTGVIKGQYKSSDGTVGLTGAFVGISNITVKDGLVVFVS